MLVTPQRMVLVERCENTAKGSRANAIRLLTGIFNDLNHAGRLAGVTFHCWWPSSNDPRILYYVPENAQRIN